VATLLLIIAVFALGAGVALGGYAVVSGLPDFLKQRRLARRLEDVAAPAELPGDDGGLVRRKAEGPLPAIDRFVAGSAAGSRLAKLIEQAGVRTSPSGMILWSVGASIAGFLVASLFPVPRVVLLVGALVGLAAPWAFLLRRRSSRLYAFEEMFPDALDLLARALRAGHAFQTALGMAATEMRSPVGPEFKKTFDQQNFGLPLKEALGQMSERVPILDVRFFVTAVVIQRETGGNLSEILENLASVVRERFKIRRQVRVHTAHGRFTAFVLLALPAALAVALSFLSPDQMHDLFYEPMGRTMLTVAMVMQTIGFFWIRKVIQIEV
jgi:tight adherence protein B